MTGYNGAAWTQFHRGRRLGVIPAPAADQPRFICPDCGLLMTRQWHQSIFGCDPETYGPPAVRYVDPSDRPHFYEDTP